MEIKEVIKNSSKQIKKEKEWILLEGRYIQKLLYAVKTKDIKLLRRFERKAARAERRIHQFEERILELLDILRNSFHNWDSVLYEMEQKIRLYDNNILKKVSYIDGTIPALLKKGEIDFEQVKQEIESALEKGVQPLIILLDHVDEQLNKIDKEYDSIRENNILVKKRSIENSLNQKPFLAMFHSANEKKYVNSILAQRNDLPDKYMGRNIEYAFEVDYFWIKHNGKITGFFGHDVHMLGDVKLLLQKSNKFKNMRWSKDDNSAENLLKRKGLLIPEWLLSRIGKIKLVVEIKAGWGDDEEALNQLVKLIKMYHLEDSVYFYAFSEWALSYLKQRLPRCFTILISWNFGQYVVHMPLNRPHKIISKFWKIPFKKHHFENIDAFVTPAKKNEQGIINQIEKTTSKGKYHLAGRVKTREQFEWLLKHGSRGGLLWISPQKIIGWLIESRQDPKK